MHVRQECAAGIAEAGCCKRLEERKEERTPEGESEVEHRASAARDRDTGILGGSGIGVLAVTESVLQESVKPGRKFAVGQRHGASFAVRGAEMLSHVLRSLCVALLRLLLLEQASPSVPFSFLSAVSGAEGRRFAAAAGARGSAAARDRRSTSVRVAKAVAAQGGERGVPRVGISGIPEVAAVLFMAATLTTLSRRGVWMHLTFQKAGLAMVMEAKVLEAERISQQQGVVYRDAVRVERGRCQRANRGGHVLRGRKRADALVHVHAGAGGGAVRGGGRGVRGEDGGWFVLGAARGVQQSSELRG